MDKLETSSNISGAYSTSNLSSISGLTGYEDEINEIRSLIELSNSAQKSPSKHKPKENTETFPYEIRISNLTSELQNVLKLNEKYKNDLFNMQRQQDLHYHEKFEKLLKKSSYLEAQLDNANAYIRNLKKGQSFQADGLQNKVADLQQENYNLKSRITDCESDLGSCKNEEVLLVSSLQEAGVKLSRLEEDLKMKIGCVDELKRKVGDQHMEIQELIQKDVKNINNLSGIQNELDNTQQSLVWYKQRLQESRAERNKLTMEVTDLKNQVLNKNHDVEKLSKEVDDWKCKYRELSIIYERDKNYYNTQSELKHEQIIQSEHCRFEQALDESYSMEGMRSFYEKEVADITNEMMKVKLAIDEQNLQYDKIIKDNAELLSRNTTLQKTLNDIQLQLEIEKTSKLDSARNLEEVVKTLKIKENQMLVLTTDVEKMRLKMDNAIREKDEVTKATVLIRNDFQKFLKVHNDLKNQLEDKNRVLLDLQKHKQELFMQNNWSVCEIEEFKHKEKEFLAKISALNRENLGLKKFETVSSDLKRSCDNLSSENGILRSENREVKDKLAFLQNQLEQLRLSLSDYEHKINFYKQSIEGLNASLKEAGEHVEVKDGELEDARMMFNNIVEILCQKFDAFTRNNSFDLASIKDLYKNNNYSTAMKDVHNNNNSYTSIQDYFKNNYSNASLRKNDFFNNGSTQEDICGNNHSKNELYIKNTLSNYNFNTIMDSFSLSSEGSNSTSPLSKDLGRDRNATTPVEDFYKSKTLIKNNLNTPMHKHNNSVKDYFSNNNTNRNHDLFFDDIVIKLDLTLKKFDRHIAEQKENIRKVNVSKVKILRGEVYERIKMLENRSYLLTEKCLRTENAFCKLESICARGMRRQSVNEEILKLQAVIKVKDLEMQEKQKRYEVNNRTLLRKIKEHMRGRNSAQKQCKYLQELYNDTVEDLNNKKLLLCEREYEIESQKKAVENKERVVVKLQNSVANLELRLQQNCAGCVENEGLRMRLSEVEMKLISAQNTIDVQTGDFRAKEATVVALKKQLSDLTGNLNCLQEEHFKCQGVQKQLTNEINEARIKCEALQGELDAAHKKYEDLNLEYSSLHVENCKHLNTIRVVQLEMVGLKENKEYFMKEIEMINCNLHQRDVEIDSLKSLKTTAQTENTQKESRLQNLLTKYELELKDSRDTLKLMNSEKYFLQRLSNDLKVALNITLKQNQTLKEKLSGHNHETDFRSLPEFLSNLPGPSNYDDTRIKNLVKITDNLEKQKPLTNLHDSLNSLKREMATLQQQIAEKKYVASSL